MATQARVTSTEAFESFRANLIVFKDKARRAVDGAGDEVKNMRNWLQQTQTLHWQGELRRRHKRVDQLQQELLSAKITANSAAAMMIREAAVEKAKREVMEAEDKLKRIKRWCLQYDSAVEPLVKKLENLRQVLDSDMPKAIAYLVNAQRTLEAYSDTAVPYTDSLSAPGQAAAPELPSAPEPVVPPEVESAPAEVAPAEVQS